MNKLLIVLLTMCCLVGCTKKCEEKIFIEGQNVREGMFRQVTGVWKFQEACVIEKNGTLWKVRWNNGGEQWFDSTDKKVNWKKAQ